MKPAFKIVLSLLLFVVSLSFLTTTPSFAAEPNICTEPGNILDISKISQCWSAKLQTAFSLNNMITGALCNIAPYVPNTKCPYETINQNGQIQLGLYDQAPNGGAIGSLSSAVAILYTPPTSTVEYLAYVKDQINPVKPAYAQVSGSGEGIIRPVLELWNITRNLAYLGFTIIFLVVGFMIMFRQKIGQQAIVTVQAALPGLVIGLILVTSSYFLSALLVDLSFIGVQLGAQIFAGLPNAFGDKDHIIKLAKDSNIFEIFASSFRLFENQKDVQSSVGQILQGSQASTGIPVTAIIQGVALGVVGGLFGIIPGILAGIGGGVAGLAGFDGVSLTASLIIPLILIIALIIQMFRLLFKLINAYISILVATVTAPFIILFSSLPGKSGTLSTWWKTILGNALIFPAVFLTFLFAGLILQTKPEAWSATPPLFGQLSTGFLRIIIAYGILLGIPAVPDMIKAALGVKDIKGIPEAAQQAAVGTSGVLYGGAISSIRGGARAAVPGAPATRAQQIIARFRNIGVGPGRV